MRLTLETREVGRVTIIRCSGRIIAGLETESLNAHLASLMATRSLIVLNLREVEFVDSCGLGAMVRASTSARHLKGAVILCNLPEPILRVLTMTHLVKLFEIYDSEEKAVAAFHRLIGSWEKLKIKGPCILCIDHSEDVLAYLKELLRRAGYHAYTCNNLHDSLMLMRVSPPRLLVLGAHVGTSPATQQAFDSECGKFPVIELRSEFSTLDAGEAASGLLGKIAARLAATAQAGKGSR